MRVIQRGYYFGPVDLVDNFKILPSIIDSDCYKLSNYKSYNILFMIKTGHLKNVLLYDIYHRPIQVVVQKSKNPFCLRLFERIHEPNTLKVRL